MSKAIDGFSLGYPTIASIPGKGQAEDFSRPKFLGVEPDRAAPLIADPLHHVLRATRSVAALAVPEADEIKFVGAEARALIEHPAVVALIGILAFRQRAKLAWRDMQCAARFGGEKSRPPVLVGEIDRLLEEGRLLERDVHLEQGGARERGLREQEVAPAGAAANAKVIRADVEVRQSAGYRLRGHWLFVGRKARLLAAWGVDHVAAE
jgi:hypothetical protein